MNIQEELYKLLLEADSVTTQKELSNPIKLKDTSDTYTDTDITKDLNGTDTANVSEPEITDDAVDTTSFTDIGKAYTMKQIYYKLLSIYNILNQSTQSILLKQSNNVKQAIDLFNLVVTNPTAYKENMDNIITMFYKYLNRLYDLLEKYYSNLDKKLE